VSPFFPTGRSILDISCRGITQQERDRGTESKQGRRGRQRNRRQGKQERLRNRRQGRRERQKHRRQGKRRMQRTRRTLLRAAHGLPKATSTPNPAKEPRRSQLQVCILLVSPLRPHLPPLLGPQSPRAGLVSGRPLVVYLLKYRRSSLMQRFRSSNEYFHIFCLMCSPNVLSYTHTSIPRLLHYMYLCIWSYCIGTLSIFSLNIHFRMGILE
jgi:hypothetical protein